MKPKHIISFSGGKDSTAMLLRMIELNMPIDDIIFADTGLEFPELYKYIKKIEKHIKRKITIVKGKNSWDKWFYGKFTRGNFKGQIRGFPYMINKCWGTRELKVKPLEKLQGKGNIVYLGIANDEKHRTNRKGSFKYPLVEWGWSEAKCIQYLKQKKLLNPLYYKFKRLGCYLCPKQNLESLRILYEDYPNLWVKLKQYEKDSPQGFKPNFKLQEFENKWKHQKRLN